MGQPLARREVAAGVVRRALTVAVALALVVLAGVRTIRAHEIPSDVTIQTYIKPDGQRLLMLVRVPLNAMRDMTWPFRAPDVLDLARAPFELNNAATLWVGDEHTMFEGDRALPSPQVLDVRATPVADGSFETFERAYAWMTGPHLPDATEVTIKDGFLDILFAYPIQSAASRFSIEPRWGRLGLQALTVLRYVLPSGEVRVMQAHGDPGLIRLDPTPSQVASKFFQDGLELLAFASDYLLFLACLVLPFRKVREILIVAAAYILAHSVTLVAAIYEVTPDALWFPPFITALVATSIVYVAIDNLIGTRLERRWVAAFALGIIHGFASSIALSVDVPFAGAHPLVSALAFNAGIELGVLVFIVVVSLAAALVFRYLTPAHVGVIVASAVIGHTGWHWMLQRGDLALQYRLTWPEMTPAFLAAALRWLMYAVGTAGALWFVSVLAKSRRETSEIQN
jgi:hypothetical protein